MTQMNKQETKWLHCDTENEKKEAVALAARLLVDGQVVAVPTETVYGLAANAENEEAVREIFRVKGRPQDNPLIVHIADLSMLDNVAVNIPEAAYTLARKFWPGPLTIILPRSGRIPATVSAGMDTIAVRFPSHPVAQAVILASGKPLAAPSANRSGIPSPTEAAHVYADMNGRIPLILDGGPCSVGVESTVVTLCAAKPRILRPGYITKDQLEEALGEEVEIDEACLKPMKKGTKVASPGMKYQHYAPNTRLTLAEGNLEDFISYAKRAGYRAALCYEEDEAALKAEGFSCVCCGREADGASQAKELFRALRKLDELGEEKAIGRMPGCEDVELAVLNRLIRAAAFRVVCAATGEEKPVENGEIMLHQQEK